eukprot:3049539-Pleurochrysis_carterae.AAC.1
MESVVSTLNVNRAVEILVGSLVDGFSDRNMTPIVIAFRSCTNLQIRVGRRALIPSSSLTPVLDLTPTTSTMPISPGRMCGLRAWIACCRESHATLKRAIAAAAPTLPLEPRHHFRVVH